MPVIFNATSFLTLVNGTDSGGTLSWTSVSNSDVPLSVTDSNGDGNLDTGVDYFLTTTYPYSGYSIILNGREYAIFANISASNDYYIPYDSSVDDLSALIGGMPLSTTLTNENGTAQNFCFLGGTRIATPTGETAVEDLAISDLVITADGRSVAVKWIGRQQVSTPVNAAFDDGRAPVCICAGALGNDADLFVSADHGMIVDGFIVNAAALVNGDTIRFVPARDLPSEFTYYHVETENHDVILANGAPAETFVDAAGRAAFDNHLEYIELHGVERIIPEMPGLRITSRRMLPQSIRDRLGIVEALPALKAG